MGTGILNTEFGEKRILLLDDHIHRGPDQDGRSKVEDLVENGVEGGQDHRAAVRNGVIPEAGEGVGFLNFSHRDIMPLEEFKHKGHKVH